MKDTEQIKKIYQNIRNFRELKNITREQMAADLDMSVSGYAKIERGEVDIAISKLYKVVELLEVKLQQILDFQVAQIFNYKDSNNIQYNQAKSEMNIHSDAYLEKYVKILEQEVERLKKRKIRVGFITTVNKFQVNKYRYSMAYPKLSRLSFPQ